MSEKEKILSEALEKLKMLEEIENENIAKYKENITHYQESNREINEEEIVDFSNSEINEIKNRIEVFLGNKEEIKEVYAMYFDLRNEIDEIINYEVSYGNLMNFCNMIFDTKINMEDGLYDSVVGLGYISNIKVPFTKREIDDMNKKAGEIIASCYQLKFGMATIPQTEKKKIIDSIKEKLAIARNIYDKSVVFASNISTSIDKIIKELEITIKRIQERERLKRQLEIKNNIDSLTDKIQESEEKIKAIENIKKLYAEYQETKSHDTLNLLTNGLVNLSVLTSRNAKIITYIEKEKETNNSNKKVETITTVQEPKVEHNLDSDYFRRPETKHIICFLGDKENEILDDIDSHFDGKNKLAVLTEMENLFNFLYRHETDNDNYVETGGNPKYFSDKLAQALTKLLDFSYRRFGVSKDQYRIHAIVRHSDLLNELGYGTGNIVFFGAVGVNDTTKKSDAYHRIGSRAIESLSTGGGVPKLRKNFDYIEHIIKKEIPYDLLSDDDKNRKKMGNFNGKIKGTRVDKAYENMRYFYYDILDDNSKRNVKKYLDDYFLSQTNSMFEILDERKKLKGDTLD